MTLNALQAKYFVHGDTSLFASKSLLSKGDILADEVNARKGTLLVHKIEPHKLITFLRNII